MAEKIGKDIIKEEKPGTPKESQAGEEQAKGPQTVAPGGKAMPFLFLGIGIFFFCQSLLLHQKDPTLDGYATFPLLITGIIILLALVDIWQNRKIPTENQGKSLGEKIKNGVRSLLPTDTLIMVVFVFVYLAALELGLGFVISSTAFLFISMCYLIPKKMVKNVIYTAVIMVAIYAIFKILFQVYLP